MSPVQFFILMSAIYLAPRVSPSIGVLAGVVFLSASVFFWLRGIA